jgi:hypothetical protein
LAELPLVIASNKQQPVGLGENPKLVDPVGRIPSDRRDLPTPRYLRRIEHPPVTKIGKINCSPFLDFIKRTGPRAGANGANGDRDQTEHN